MCNNNRHFSCLPKQFSTKMNTCFLFRFQGFQYHTKKEHNQWSYVFFFLYLDRKKFENKTALECYVSDKVPFSHWNSVTIALSWSDFPVKTRELVAIVGHVPWWWLLGLLLTGLFEDRLIYGFNGILINPMNGQQGNMPCLVTLLYNMHSQPQMYSEVQKQRMPWINWILGYPKTSTGIDADTSKGETSPGYFNSKLVYSYKCGTIFPWEFPEISLAYSHISLEGLVDL